MDLIGMGDSEKLEDDGNMTYSYAVHKKYFDGFLAELGIKNNAILVIHDWGSADPQSWITRIALFLIPNSAKNPSKYFL